MTVSGGRLLAALAILLMVVATLTGCASTAPKQDPPVIHADRSAGTLRDGLWTWADPECHPSKRLPLRSWPDCAKAGMVMVRGGELLMLAGSGFGGEPGFGGSSLMRDEVRTGGPWQVSAYLFAEGNPALLRLPHSAIGEYLIDGDLDPSGVHNYFGVEVKERDVADRVTGLRLWPIWCEVPPDGVMSKAPGVRWDAPRHACRVTSMDTVRAVALSQGFEDFDFFVFRWVRDVRPDDFARP